MPHTHTRTAFDDRPIDDLVEYINGNNENSTNAKKGRKERRRRQSNTSATPTPTATTRGGGSLLAKLEQFTDFPGFWDGVEEDDAVDAERRAREDREIEEFSARLEQINTQPREHKQPMPEKLSLNHVMAGMQRTRDALLRSRHPFTPQRLIQCNS